MVAELGLLEQPKKWEFSLDRNNRINIVAACDALGLDSDFVYFIPEEFRDIAKTVHYGVPSYVDFIVERIDAKSIANDNPALVFPPKFVNHLCMYLAKEIYSAWKQSDHSDVRDFLQHLSGIDNEIIFTLIAKLANVEPGFNQNIIREFLYFWFMEIPYKYIAKQEDPNFQDSEQFYFSSEMSNILQAQLKQMRELQKANPDICAVTKLRNQFQLRSFSRYKVEDLTAQLSQPNEELEPVLFLISGGDHNGLSFFRAGHCPHGITADIFGDQPVQIITYEFCNDQELDVALSSYRRKYGPAKEVFIMAHGGPNGIGTEPGKTITAETLMKSGTFLRATHSSSERPALLHKDANVRLFACSTGADNGFAQALSKQASPAKFFGPSTPINRSISRTTYFGCPDDTDHDPKNFKIMPYSVYQSGKPIQTENLAQSQ